MTDESQTIDRIDKERQKRERELLLLLLLTMERSERDAVRAARIGTDPIAAASNAWNGNQSLAHPGVVPSITEAMVNAHASGMRRVARLAGLSPAPTDPQDLKKIGATYRPIAERMADGIWTKVTDTIRQELTNFAGESVNALVNLLRTAFDDAGVTRTAGRLLETWTERAIVGSNNGGLFEGGQSHLIVTGFVHRSVLDDGTTEICRERDGLILPKTDPYWMSNWCPLHWGCRSMGVPVLGRFTPSEWRPQTPPSPGFGHAPFRDLAPLNGVGFAASA